MKCDLKNDFWSFYILYGFSGIIHDRQGAVYPPFLKLFTHCKSP